MNAMYKSFIFALLILVLPLTACGIKPDHVDPPPGAESLVYPKTYPDISTDPQPQ
jgi:hypothetical protein